MMSHAYPQHPRNHYQMKRISNQIFDPIGQYLSIHLNCQR